MKTIKINTVLIAFFAVIFYSFTATSCSNDEDYADYVVGSWTAEYYNLTDQRPSGRIHSTYTFKGNGTGYIVDKDSEAVEDYFTYTVTSFDDKSGTKVDFIINIKTTNPDGSVKYAENYGGIKTSGKTWDMTDEYGIQKYYLMSKK